MNEIRLLKDLESQIIEIEPAEPGATYSAPCCPEDRTPPGPEEPPPPFPPYVPSSDRRVAQRYRAKEGRCWVGWHDAGSFRQSAAWIIDISSSGGLIATDAPPPADRSVWLRLDNAEVPDWAEARLVTLQTSHTGIFAARIVFRGICPYPLIKAVAFGTANPHAPRPEPSPSWNLNAW
jgi:hypothetical protein